MNEIPLDVLFAVKPSIHHSASTPLLTILQQRLAADNQDKLSLNELEKDCIEYLQMFPGDQYAFESEVANQEQIVSFLDKQIAHEQETLIRMEEDIKSLIQKFERTHSEKESFIEISKVLKRWDDLKPVDTHKSLRLEAELRELNAAIAELDDLITANRSPLQALTVLAQELLLNSKS
ncbi:hypothetical protein RCL1_004473 [Eukaryota sp. TZLM3-RCL]